jgi:hypothetical protein
LVVVAAFVVVDVADDVERRATLGVDAGVPPDADGVLATVDQAAIAGELDASGRG